MGVLAPQQLQQPTTYFGMTDTPGQSPLTYMGTMSQ